MSLQMHPDTILGELIFRNRVQSDLKKLHILTEMLQLIKKSCNHFRYNELARNILSSPAVYGLLQKLTSSKYQWTWNSTYQNPTTAT